MNTRKLITTIMLLSMANLAYGASVSIKDTPFNATKIMADAAYSVDNAASFAFTKKGKYQAQIKHDLRKYLADLFDQALKESSSQPYWSYLDVDGKKVFEHCLQQNVVTDDNTLDIIITRLFDNLKKNPEESLVKRLSRDYSGILKAAKKSVKETFNKNELNERITSAAKTALKSQIIAQLEPHYDQQVAVLFGEAFINHATNGLDTTRAKNIKKFIEREKTDRRAEVTNFVKNSNILLSNQEAYNTCVDTTIFLTM